MKKSEKNLPLFPEIIAPSETDPFFYETLARKMGYGLIAGVDEAGRGPLAGPVVAAAVIIRQGERLSGIRDSKKMTERSRERAFPIIHQGSVNVSIGVVSSTFVDRYNILKATLEAMKQAVLTLEPVPDYLLIDGIHPIPVSTPQKCLIRGDQISRSISAASVIAKVYRDRIMMAYHGLYPGYGFLKNKGYGTKDHLAALRKLGPCPIHRLTFKGVFDLES